MDAILWLCGQELGLLFQKEEFRCNWSELIQFSVGLVMLLVHFQLGERRDRSNN